MSRQLGFYFESAYCIGCNACRVACTESRGLPPGLSYRRVYELESGGFSSEGGPFAQDVKAFWISISCCHCRAPACAAACPAGAIAKRGEDGLVLIDSGLCSGCGLCATACPYGAIVFRGPGAERSEASGAMGDRVAAKCDLCVELRAAGRPPACVSACPMRALDAGDMEELRSRHCVGERRAGERRAGERRVGEGRDCSRGEEAQGLPDSKATGPSLIVRERRGA